MQSHQFFGMGACGNSNIKRVGGESEHGGRQGSEESEVCV